MSCPISKHDSDSISTTCYILSPGPDDEVQQESEDTEEVDLQCTGGVFHEYDLGIGLPYWTKFGFDYTTLPPSASNIVTSSTRVRRGKEKARILSQG